MTFQCCAGTTCIRDSLHVDVNREKDKINVSGIGPEKCTGMYQMYIHRLTIRVLIQDIHIISSLTLC